MTDDIKDILAAFETHHRRAVSVMTKLVPTINKTGLIMTLLSEQHEDNGAVYLRTKSDLVEGLQDIAEIFDSFTEDFIALEQNHTENLARILRKG